MDLYEYQARELLSQEDIPIPAGIYVKDSSGVNAAIDIVGLPCVIKAQVKIGHRGQSGGVKLARTRAEAISYAKQILPMSIQGHQVNGILVCAAEKILHEYYVSISLDRTSRDFDVLAIAHGGTEVEEVAKAHPENIKRLHIEPLDTFDEAAAVEMAKSIGFYHADVHQAADILLKMWKVFKKNDATLVEINPLAKIGSENDESSKSLCALDAKISLDSNASFRHPEWKNFIDTDHADPLEMRASKNHLHYVRLDGQVGVIGNGAGLVMSSLDAVASAGSSSATQNAINPANFLDIGGGASSQIMSESLEIVASDTNVLSIFVNVYGGLTSCKVVAQGILEAIKKQNLSKPIVVRFDGNQAAEGLQMLSAASNPLITVESTMEKAASKAVALAREQISISTQERMK